MKLATIEKIDSIESIPNADTIVLATVANFKAVIKKDQYKVGDTVCYIFPDTVLPEKPWSVPYRSKSSRVKAIKLRGTWSEGVVESLQNVGYTGPVEIGLEISEAIGVVKYEPALPQDLNAVGVYGNGIPKTDESRWNQVRDLPWGELVDVTLKIDGQSWSAFTKLDRENRKIEEGVGGRSFLYQLDCINNYTQNQANYDVLNKLRRLCLDKDISLCIRGEQYGHGIQKGKHNPHAQLNLNLAFFSTWLIDERRYATKGHPHYIFDLAPKLELPTVPMIERDVPLTPELIQKYAKDLTILNGLPFEGVVINHKNGSFKVISLDYDSKK